MFKSSDFARVDIWGGEDDGVGEVSLDCFIITPSLHFSQRRTGDLGGGVCNWVGNVSN